MPLAGIEPTLIAYETNILPLNYRGYLKLAAPAGIAPNSFCFKDRSTTFILRSYLKFTNKTSEALQLASNSNCVVVQSYICYATKTIHTQAM